MLFHPTRLQGCYLVGYLFCDEIIDYVFRVKGSGGVQRGRLPLWATSAPRQYFIKCNQGLNFLLKQKNIFLIFSVIAPKRVTSPSFQLSL